MTGMQTAQATEMNMMHMRSSLEHGLSSICTRVKSYRASVLFVHLEARGTYIKAMR